MGLNITKLYNLMKEAAEAVVTIGAGSDAVNALLNKHLSYVKDAPAVDANGDPFVHRTNSTDQIWDATDRITVEMALYQILQEQGDRDEQGRLKMFAPVVLPMHVVDGEQITQLRVFLFRQRADEKTEQNPYPQPKPTKCLFRIEPFGTVTQYEAAKAKEAADAAIATRAEEAIAE